jgi:DNA mismatch repair protein MutS
MLNKIVGDHLKQEEKSLPPMMTQYWNIKKSYSDYLVLFRVGDFFELFYEDAKIANKALGLTLTQKVYGKKAQNTPSNLLSQCDTEPSEPSLQEGIIPMCGMPHHIYLQYCYKLVLLNHKVVICDQTETPEEAKLAKRTVVNRQITKILTKSTIYYENDQLDLENHFLISIMGKSKDNYNLLICDISTSDYFYKNCQATELNSFIGKINPEEIILSKHDAFRIDIANLLQEWKEKIVQWVPKVNISINVQWQKYGEHLSESEKNNIYSLISYLQEHGIDMQQCKNTPQEFPFREYITLDSKTIKNLHILPDNQLDRGKNQFNSVLSTVDFTSTPMGKRYLKQLLLFPSTNLNIILERQNKVMFFINLLKNSMEISMHGIGDVEKLLSQCIRKKITPIMLIRMAKSIKKIMNLLAVLKRSNYPGNLNYECYAADLILNTMEEEEHVLNNMIIRAQNVPILEDYRHQIYVIEEKIKKLLQEYNVKYQINNIKVKSDSRLNYYLESPKSQEKNILAIGDFRIVQYGINYVRFVSKEFSQLSREKETIEEEINSITESIINQLVEKVGESFKEIQHIIKEITEIDSLLSLAKAALQYKYVLPKLNHTQDIYIKNGRHPMADRTISNFVPNSIAMGGDNNMHIITGPNMGGKSTFLRQNAIIVILSQIGSLVPAQEASIGLVDNIFSRIGADDNLIGGESTFMVEMQEISHMLKEATPKSLMIIDELGRGTSVKDGAAIATAVVEYICHKLHCRCIFSTHFHSICKDLSNIPSVAFFHFGYILKDEQIFFTYKIQNNICDESFGIYVAKLAGISQEIINRAINIVQMVKD